MSQRNGKHDTTTTARRYCRSTFSLHFNGVQIDLKEDTQTEFRSQFYSHSSCSSTRKSGDNSIFSGRLDGSWCEESHEEIPFFIPEEVHGHAYFKIDHPSHMVGYALVENEKKLARVETEVRANPTRMDVSRAPCRVEYRHHPACCDGYTTTNSRRQQNTIDVSRSVVFVHPKYGRYNWRHTMSKEQRPPAPITINDDKDVTTIDIQLRETFVFEHDDVMLMHIAQKGSPTQVAACLLRQEKYRCDEKEDMSLLALRKNVKKQHTALHLAASGHHLEMVKLLVGAGADVNAKTNRGLTPLMAAIRGLRINDTLDKSKTHRLSKLLSALRGDGGDLSDDNEALPPPPPTDQHWQRQLDVIHYLLQHGADPNDATLKHDWRCTWTMKKLVMPPVSALGLTIHKFFYSPSRGLNTHRFNDVMSLLMGHIPNGKKFIFCRPPLTRHTYSGSDGKELPPVCWARVEVPPHPTQCKRPVWATTNQPPPVISTAQLDPNTPPSPVDVDPTFQSSAWHYILRRCLTNPAEDPLCCEGLVAGKRRGNLVGYQSDLPHPGVALSDVLYTVERSRRGFGLQRTTDKPSSLSWNHTKDQIQGANITCVVQSGLGAYQLLLDLPQCGMEAAHRAYVDLLMDGNFEHYDSNCQVTKPMTFVPDFSPRFFVPISPEKLETWHMPIRWTVDDKDVSIAARLGAVVHCPKRETAKALFQRPALHHGFIL